MIHFRKYDDDDDDGSADEEISRKMQKVIILKMLHFSPWSENYPFYHVLRLIVYN